MTATTTAGAAAPTAPGNHRPESVWRASDADRERVAQTVHEAVSLGMLTMGEAEERLTAVYAARFCHELTPITADLPIGHPSTAAAGAAQWSRRMFQLVAAVLAIVAPLWATVRAFTSRHKVVTVIVAALGVALLGTALFFVATDALVPDGVPD